MTILIARSKGSFVTSIKNADAVHGLGKERFSSVPAIATSSDAYAMQKAMWAIEDSDPADEEQAVLRLRVITFLDEHNLARRK